MNNGERKKSGAWKRKQAKKIVRRAKTPMFRNRIMKGMDNAHGGPRFNLANCSGTKLMKKQSKKKSN